VWRLAEAGAEAADEVRLGEARHRGHGADVERLRVGPIHRIAGAQQPSVQVLDLPGHGATLHHQMGVRQLRVSARGTGLPARHSPPVSNRS
jgi:hypothetical protein